MYIQARNGGSITPRYRKVLNDHVASGKISLHTDTSLRSVEWDAQLKTWRSVVTVRAVELPPIDYIVFATGVQSDVTALPFLDSIRTKHPIEYQGGLPCLNDDLMWSDDVPLFFNGRFAGLRLGPGAPNLVGCRIGAERIAWNVKDVLETIERAGGSGETDIESGDEKMEEYAAGRRNRYDSLVDIGEL
jgi:hypothetical protein